MRSDNQVGEVSRLLERHGKREGELRTEILEALTDKEMEDK